MSEHNIDSDGDFVIERDHPDPDMSTYTVSYYCAYGLIINATDEEWAALNAYRKALNS